jgi:hypothetical protein
VTDLQKTQDVSRLKGDEASEWVIGKDGEVVLYSPSEDSISFGLDLMGDLNPEPLTLIFRGDETDFDIITFLAVKHLTQSWDLKGIGVLSGACLAVNEIMRYLGHPVCLSL